MAKIHSYNNEIKNATAQILDVFNDITISRYDNVGQVMKDIRVPCIFGDRSRILKSLENKQKTVELPIIIVSLQGISRDTTRVMDVNTEIMYQDGSGYFDYTYKTPVPMNLKYTVEFIAKKTEDLMQLLSNWSVWFNPDIFVVTPNIYDKGEYLKSQVLWAGDFDVNMNSDITPQKSVRLSGKSSFTFKTWLFVGDGTMNNNENKRIPKRINRINFNPNIVDKGDGHGARLSKWYDVPNDMKFKDFSDNVVLGLVDQGDHLAISGGVSGYWHDISALMDDGEEVNAGVSEATDPKYLVVDDGKMLLIGQCGYISQGISDAIDVDAFQRFYDSVQAGGELEGFTGVDPE